MTLTLNQKRFLILWILFHSFALFVNLAGVNGFTSINDHEYVCFFTNTLPGQYPIGFWPFVTFSPNTIYYDRIVFNGIFYSYEFPEYIFYMCLGLGIVFIPKLLTTETKQKSNIMKSLPEIKTALEKELSKYEVAYPDINTLWELKQWDNDLSLFIKDDIEENLRTLIHSSYLNVSS